MARDFIVEIQPDGPRRLALRVKTPDLGEAGELLKRKWFTLSSDEVDELRRGRPTPKTVAAVRDKLSAWLLSNDLRPYLSAALGHVDAGPLRLVIAPDERILPQLADVPFELLALDESEASFVVMNAYASAMVHRLPKARQLSTERKWPLRILLVRTNPGDQTGTVPRIGPLRDSIVKLGQALGPGLVQVDMLSNEPVDGQRGPAVTWAALQEQLRGAAYDILVYLGHGDLQTPIPGAPPAGILLFETDGGELTEAHTRVQAHQLRSALSEQRVPVPVIILAGCLTAAEALTEKEQALEPLVPTRARGSQAVAQALVNASDSGVQLVVGMRYRLGAAAATTFLEELFQSLFKRQPGDVEAAVRAGRRGLFQKATHPPDWSAPVIFRTLGAEPFFDFMTRLPETAHDPVAQNGREHDAAPSTAVPAWLPDPADERDLAYRTAAWDALVQQPASTRTPESRAFPCQILDDSERRLRERALPHGIVVTPDRVETHHNQDVTVRILLHGAAGVTWLEGRLVTSTELLTICAVEATPELRAAGFRVLVDRESPISVYFRVQRVGGPGPAALPAHLLAATLHVGAGFPVVYTVRADVVEMQPVRPVYSIGNAVIVLAP